MPDVNIIVKAKDQASAALKDISKNVKGVTTSLGKLGIGGPLALAGIAAGVGKLAWDAMKLEPTRITFENLTESIDSTADAMLMELRPATLGMVSDADLMASANKLVSMGLAKTDKEAAKLAKMATTLGMAMGKGPTQAMEEFALMMANQSIPRLDTFGISAGTVRTRITELMEATKGLTREDAFMQAVMEQGAISMDRVGDISDTTAVKMARVQTAVSNIKDGIGAMLIPVLDAGASAFLDFQESAANAAEELEKLKTETYEEVESAGDYVKEMIEASGETERYAGSLGGARYAVELMRLEQEHATLVTQEQKEEFEKLVGPLEAVLDATANLDDEMAIIAGVTEEAAVAYADWATALDDVQTLIKEQEKYVSALEEAAGYAKELGLAEAERTLKIWAAVEAIKEVGPEAKKAFIDEMLTYIEQTREPMEHTSRRAEIIKGNIEEIGPAFDKPIGLVEEFSAYWKNIKSKTIRLDVQIYYEHIGKPVSEKWLPSGPGGAVGFEEGLEDALRDTMRYGL